MSSGKTSCDPTSVQTAWTQTRRQAASLLSSVSSAAELLQCARPDADGVYINADRTPAEALAAFQARERRRERRPTGINYKCSNYPASLFIHALEKKYNLLVTN